MQYLERPTIIYIIIFLFSAVAAIIFYIFGGSIAEVTNQKDTWLGISFRATGALGGFIIIFFVSLKALERIERIKGKLKIRLYLRGIGENFQRNIQYNCEYIIFNQETGDRIEKPITHRWDEGGFFTLDVIDLSPDDLIAVRIKHIMDSKEKTWESNFIDPRNIRTLELPLID